MNISYLMYQAERPRGAAEQREADVLAGQLAASVASVGRSLRQYRRLTAKQSRKQAANRPATTVPACAIPRPR
jgi:hypothetical protein